MGTRVGKRNNWQADPAVGEDPRQGGASVIRVSIEAVHFHFDPDAIYENRTESFLV